MNMDSSNAAPAQGGGGETLPNAEVKAADAATLVTGQQQGQGGEKAATVLSQEKASTSVAAPADWPDDWRVKLAGEDKKLLTRLERMGSPADLLASYRALEQRLSSGELKSALPKDATPEQVAAWRKENGVPEKAEAYLDKLPDGLVIGEDDKTLMNSFAEAMHGQNVPPTVVHEAIKWYYGLQEQEAARQSEIDDTARGETETALRAEWGSAYQQNINLVKNLLGGAPESVRADLESARFPNGTPIFSNPDTLRWLANLSRQVNPVSTIVPAGGDIGSTVTNELADLKKMMADYGSDYWKGPKAETLQARYRQLIDWQDRQAKAS